MRFVLPGIVFAIFSGLTGIYRLHADSILPPTKVVISSHSAKTFINYADALTAFQLRNPSFVGSVTATQLAEIGRPISASFLASAGNSITAFGANGRILTAYATLQPGALGEIIAITESDASYGTVNGNTWTSVIPGSTSQPLGLTAPLGSIVYVSQTGR